MSAREARRVAAASAIGTTVEWYDFFIYGTAAATVFGPRFFPQVSPVAATLAAFATFGIGFIARPVGGIVMGHFGDRIGRKSMLVLTLVIMGVATFLIGVLPTYGQIGPWAAVLLVLLRIAQGFGVGGEWGGAALLATEHAPHGKRGWFGMFPQLGPPADRANDPNKYRRNHTQWPGTGVVGSPEFAQFIANQGATYIVAPPPPGGAPAPPGGAALPRRARSRRRTSP